MKYQKLFLLLALTLLLVGISFATEVSDDTASVTDTSSTADNVIDTVQPTTTTTKEVDNNVIEEPQDNNKQIQKADNKTNVKTTKTTYTTTVSSYSQLVNKVQEAKELDGDEIIINLKKGNYYANELISWKETFAANTLIINGNGSTIDGGNNNAFMAVSSGYTLIVKNATFKNFYKYGWGAVFYTNKGSTLEVYSCTFKDNEATDAGGAIDNNGLCRVEDCYFVGNDGGENGGAINNDGTLYVYDSIFKDGIATSSGGGICNFYYAYVYDSIFINNKARGGGALYNHYDYLYVDNAICYDNRGTYGGALSSWGTVKFKNSLIYDNIAEEGGAFNIEAGDATITYNTIIDNYADYGSGINIDGGVATVSYNTFQRNRAYYTGSNSAIRYIKNHGSLIYSGNTYSSYTLTKYEDTIYIGSNGEMYLRNNDFDDREDSYVTINNISATTYGSTIKISGKVYSDDGPIGSDTVSIYVNGAKIGTVTTGANGYFTKNYNVKKVGKNNITVSYGGDYYLLPDTGKSTVTVNKATPKITLTKISTKVYNDNIVITGKLTNNAGDYFVNSNVKVNYNGKTVTVKTDDEGIYKYTTKATKVGQNEVTVTYGGSTNYNSKTATITFTVNKRATKVTVPTISNKVYKGNVTITGKLTDNTGAAIKNTNIKVKVNTKTYTVKTNSKGVYTLKVVTNNIGKNNVTVSFAGNANYKAVTAKTSFKTVARATKITVNKIAKTTKGRTVKITGKFTDTLGTVFKNISLKIKINSKTVTVKTNSKGVYTYNYKTTTKGTNNVVISYAGNTKYKASNAKISFKVA